MKKKLVTFVIATAMILSPIKSIVLAHNYNNKSIELSNDDIQYKNSKITCSYIDEVVKVAKEFCEDRQENFTINYTGSVNDLSHVLDKLKEDMRKTDSYLYFSMEHFNISYGGFDGQIEVTFNMTYRTNKSQESYVDSKVDEILGNIIRPNMTDDRKEKAIHDYIVSHVKYDKTFKKYTAYDALYNGTCVCQGYALLTNKMLNKVGIENKIISGTAGGDHAWNLVNLHGKWYHLDCTWDDPIPDVQGRILYNYYNLSDRQMGKDHHWTNSDYPICDTKYDMNDLDKQLPKTESKKIDLNGFKQMKSYANIQTDKVWHIDFTKTIDKNSIGKGSVFVVEKDEFKNKFNDIKQLENKTFINSLNKAFVDITWNGKKTLTINPISNYKNNKTYYIIINKNVFSSYGENIPKPVIMEFTTK